MFLLSANKSISNQQEVFYYTFSIFNASRDVPKQLNVALPKCNAPKVDRNPAYYLEALSRHPQELEEESF